MMMSTKMMRKTPQPEMAIAYVLPHGLFAVFAEVRKKWIKSVWVVKLNTRDRKTVFE